MGPKVSVIIPVYNVEPYLRQYLDSVANQKLKEIEIICVDDGSTDGSGAILDEYALHDIRFKIIHKQNGGNTSARKSALEVAKAEYINYVDSDDWVEPEMLENMYTLAVKDDSDVLICRGIFLEYEGSSFISKSTIPAGTYKENNLITEIHAKMFRTVNNSVGIRGFLCAKLFKRYLIKLYQNSVDNRITISEDGVCTYQCIAHAKTVTIIEDAYYHYRKNNASSMTSNKQKDYLLNLNLVYNTLKSGFLTAQDSELLLRELTNYMASGIYLSTKYLFGNEGYYCSKGYVFPFQEVTKRCRLLLYGAGDVGIAFYRQLITTGYCSEVLWVDRNWRSIQFENGRKNMQLSNHVVVTVCCITYNQNKYIQKALDSFLMQKTTFPFEIIVHDDASTDGTAKIIREYADKYPDIIKPIFEEKNCFSRGEVFGIYTKYIFPKASGKYLAFCEGDDYWIDPHKLQLQFDYMESHPDCSLATHNVYHEDQANGQRKLHYEQLTEGEYSGEQVLTYFKLLPHTTSMFCRAEIFNKVPEYFLYSPVPDIPMQFQCLANGNIYYSERVMSVWRSAHETSWTFGMISDIKANQHHCMQMIKQYEMFDSQTERKFHNPVSVRIKQYFSNILISEAFNVDEPPDKFYIRLNQCGEYEEQILKLKEYAQKAGFAPVWNRMRDAAAKGKKLFLYGAGKYGKMAAKTMRRIGLPLKGFIVTDGQSKDATLSGVPVYYLSELPYPLDDVGILLALKPKFAKEVWTTFASHENIWYLFWDYI